MDLNLTSYWVHKYTGEILEAVYEFDTDTFLITGTDAHLYEGMTEEQIFDTLIYLDGIAVIQ